MNGLRTWRALTANLRQDRIAEGLGRDAGAVGDEEDSVVRHGCDHRESAAEAGARARVVEWVRTFHPPHDGPIQTFIPGLPAPSREGMARRASNCRPSSRARGWPVAADREAPVFSTLRSFPMSTSHLATALVAPFEQLRMADVESVGGKNASLGEMISQLAASGVRVPGGFATTAHAFSRVPAPRRAGREDRRPALDPEHR